jgi:hypothetical protein
MPDAIVINDIEEFEEDESEDDDYNGIKEFDYDDIIEDYLTHSSPPLVVQQKPPINCKNNVTTYSAPCKFLRSLSLSLNKAQRET